ncbi:MAG TPA: DUF433 domain-containing protein [Phycisphaerae bacterium]|nr:DUF433 domain-containing protein [Phycisphaerae bacterium]
MTLSVQPEAPPLRREPDGALRVGDSRILLELVLHAFIDGATPEAIVQRYPSLALSDVYAVVAYYLRHKADVDEYLAHREADAQQAKSRIDSSQPDLSSIRARLNAQRKS